MSYEVLHRTAATDTLSPLNPFCTFLHIPHTLFQSHTLKPTPPLSPLHQLTPQCLIVLPKLVFSNSLLQYLVYNARKRGADRASEYFKRTENIAGVKDMRFQALMPDILHWLGIKKIDRMLSMSK
jgi:hypothetical protein